MSSSCKNERNRTAFRIRTTWDLVQTAWDLVRNAWDLMQTAAQVILGVRNAIHFPPKPSRICFLSSRSRFCHPDPAKIIPCLAGYPRIEDKHPYMRGQM